MSVFQLTALTVYAVIGVVFFAWASRQKGNDVWLCVIIGIVWPILLVLTVKHFKEAQKEKKEG